MTKHVGMVSSDMFSDDWFIAECTCGWNGPERQTESAAYVDLESHYHATKAMDDAGNADTK